ncbi:MAG: 16S rRNA (guanine(966)-N(2))-methyltransferase RsmD [Chloroflexota bacterium]|nr:16S rRNA (guanine(966)-N(2))-methyltransferase RsmD [Chloroflexota bacterium]
MRVIAGKAKARSLKWPKEPHIRPTAGLIREAVFSSLESISVDWNQVLDLYAGTGALGIEALSRGAEAVDFVEKNPKCCSIIRENLKTTGFSKQANVYRLEAKKALLTLKKHYSLVFLDPPYFDHDGQSILQELATSGLVGDRATIVLEHSHKLQPEATCGNFVMTKSLHHGDTCVSIFQWGFFKN